jgi:hypothetical protein
MARQASAQALHALAQAWQWSNLCLPHSSVHFWQISAHSLQTAGAQSLLRAMVAAARAQICAQSISSAMHWAIILMSASFRQEAAQKLQAIAQALQASIQEAYFWVGMFDFRRCCGYRREVICLRQNG